MWNDEGLGIRLTNLESRCAFALTVQFEQFALVEMVANMVPSVVPDLRAYLDEYADCIVDPAWHGLATDFDEKSGEVRA